MRMKFRVFSSAAFVHFHRRTDGIPTRTTIRISLNNVPTRERSSRGDADVRAIRRPNRWYRRPQHAGTFASAAGVLTAVIYAFSENNVRGDSRSLAAISRVQTRRKKRPAKPPQIFRKRAPDDRARDSGRGFRCSSMFRNTHLAPLASCFHVAALFRRKELRRTRVPNDRRRSATVRAGCQARDSTSEICY